MDDLLKVSIITVCYNIVNEIERTILSIIQQTYSNIEFIIIDGGSTDGTKDVVEKFDTKITYWVSEPDKGIYDAMNKGIKIATGDWLIFMNGGDTFYDSEVISDFILKVDKDTSVAYGRTMFHIPSLNIKYMSFDKPLDLSKMKEKQSMIPHQSAFIKVNYHKKNLFDTSYKIVADYNFFYHCYFDDKCKFQYIPIVISDFWGGGLSSTHYLRRSKEKLLIAKEDYSIFSLFLLYFDYVKHKLKQMISVLIPHQILIKHRINSFKKLGCNIMNEIY